MKKLIITIFFLLVSISFVYANEHEYIVEMKQGSIPREGESLGHDLYCVDTDEAVKLVFSGKVRDICKNEDLSLYEYYSNKYYPNQTYIQTMNILPLIDATPKGKGVRVGVIDSGCYNGHADFEGANISEGYNYVAGNTDVTDTSGHGTSVMGVMAAQDNSIGVLGIAPEAEYVPLCVMYNGKGTTEHLIKALYGAADDFECDIINISLGVSTDVSILKKAVQYVTDKGIIVVAAVGNYNPEALNYPASYDNVISVNSVDNSLNLTNYAKTHGVTELSAVGTVYTTDNSGGYRSISGTSFSAPIITGMLADTLSYAEDVDVNSVIKAATLDILDSGKDFAGYGVLLGDEVLNFIQNDDKIFISPIYKNGDVYNIKLYSAQEHNADVAVSEFSNRVFKKVVFLNPSYTDGVAYMTNNSDGEVNIAAVSSIKELLPQSNIRNTEN